MRKRLSLRNVDINRLLTGLRYHVRDTKASTLALLSRLPKRPNVVVDIGAGYGGYAINFAILGIKVIAVEPELKQRMIMNELLKKYPKAKNYLIIRKGFAEKIPVRSNQADFCILSQVLEHVDKPNKVISEIARILKPGGYLHLSSPNYLFPFEQHLHTPYIPLMNKQAFLKWVYFYFWIIKKKDLKTNLVDVKSLIKEINYTTDRMVKKLCKNNKLIIIRSSVSEACDLTLQIKLHWAQNPKILQLFFVAVSLPKKVFRTIFAKARILPVKLEYLIQKS